MNTETKEILCSMRGKVLIVDCETDGLYWYTNGVIGVGIYCPSIDIKMYIPTAAYVELPYGKPKTAKVWRGDYYVKPSTGRKNKLFVQETTQPTRLTAVPDKAAISEVVAILQELASDPSTCFINHNIK